VIRLALTAAALLAPAAVEAQAYRCAIPDEPLRVRPDLPTPGQPKRVLPIGGYTLAITWTPQHCRREGRDASSRFQCGRGNRFGWTLHGLWPDGQGKTWPQYCRPTGLVPQPVIREALCATPSPQLIQHEWAKHGTCMTGYTPATYFQQATALYGRLRYPDMDALSRDSLTAGGFAAAMARVNPGLAPTMMRVTADREGWLEEVWICLDKRFRYRRCPAHQGGLPAAAPVKVWRGRR
jgi:ribonuclease T2